MALRFLLTFLPLVLWVLSSFLLWVVSVLSFPSLLVLPVLSLSLLLVALTLSISFLFLLFSPLPLAVSVQLILARLVASVPKASLRRMKGRVLVSRQSGPVKLMQQALMSHLPVSERRQQLPETEQALASTCLHWGFPLHRHHHGYVLRLQVQYQVRGMKA